MEDLVKANKQIKELEVAVSELSTKLLKALQEKNEAVRVKDEVQKSMEMINDKYRVMS